MSSSYCPAPRSRSAQSCGFQTFRSHAVAPITLASHSLSMPTTVLGLLMDPRFGALDYRSIMRRGLYSSGSRTRPPGRTLKSSWRWNEAMNAAGLDCFRQWIRPLGGHDFFAVLSVNVEKQPLPTASASNCVPGFEPSAGCENASKPDLHSVGVPLVTLPAADVVLHGPLQGAGPCLRRTRTVTGVRLVSAGP